ALVTRAWKYALGALPNHVKTDEHSIALLAYGAYVLTAFPKVPEAAQARALAEKWMEHVLSNQHVLTAFGRAWVARVEERLGHHARALALLESALDGARTDPVTGISFTPERYSWLWYSDSVEKHAFLLRTMAALQPKDPRIAGLSQWLLWNRKGNEWHS